MKMPSSFEKMCRTCMLQESKQQETSSRSRAKMKVVPQMVSIFTVPEETKVKLNLMELIKTSIPQIKIEANDELPKNVCAECLDKIKEIYKFQQNCLNNEQKFYKMLKENSEEAIISFNAPEDEDDNDDDVFKTEFDDNFMEGNCMQSDEEMIMEEEINRAAEAKEEFIESCSDWSADLDLEDDDSDTEYDPKKTSKTKKSKHSAQLLCEVKIEADEEYEITTSQDNQTTSATRKKKYTKKEKIADDLKPKLYPCDKCKRKLKSEMGFKHHQEKHHGIKATYKCSICSQVLEDKTLFKEHMRSHNGEKVYLCSECGKGYATAGGLKEHSFRHLSEKNVRCPDCPRTFTTKTDLVSHYMVHKAKPKCHICDICGRGFHKPFLLKKHKMYHTNERPFPCEFCEKRFYTNEKLKRHTRIHTGEKPYKCNYCKNAYCQSNELMKHLQIHLGENVYQCEMCPERFKTVKILRSHFATHKDDDEETKARNLAALNALELKGNFFK